MLRQIAQKLTPDVRTPNMYEQRPKKTQVSLSQVAQYPNVQDISSIPVVLLYEIMHKINKHIRGMTLAKHKGPTYTLFV